MDREVIILANITLIVQVTLHPKLTYDLVVDHLNELPDAFFFILFMAHEFDHIEWRRTTLEVFCAIMPLHLRVIQCLSL